MNRRDFITGVAAAGLALRFGPRAFAGQAASIGSLPALAAVEGESPAAITREAIAVLGGMGKFVGKGDKVVIKPNIGWDRTPEMAACTNPEVVKTLVELVLDAGAKKVIVIDNTTNQAKRCYVRSGIQEAVKQAGGDMLFVDDYRVKKMALKGEWLKEWEILLDVVEADKIINVPIAKHHSLCRLTLGAKNWLGRDRRGPQPVPPEPRQDRGRPGRVLQAAAHGPRRLPHPRPQRAAGRPRLGHRAPEDGRRRHGPRGRGRLRGLALRGRAPRAALSRHGPGPGAGRVRSGEGAH